jgi:hypothetical protein
MSVTFNEYVNSKNEVILYVGSPNLEKLEELSLGYGDVWHSSFEQGYKNAFPELVYQAIVSFYYINDFDNLDQCISWRVNPNHFAVRKSVWERIGGFDDEIKNKQLRALDFGFNVLRNCGGIPLYVKNLFDVTTREVITISTKDRYVFFGISMKSTPFSMPKIILNNVRIARSFHRVNSIRFKVNQPLVTSYRR